MRTSTTKLMIWESDCPIPPLSFVSNQRGNFVVNYFVTLLLTCQPSEKPHTIIYDVRIWRVNFNLREAFEHFPIPNSN